MNKPVSGVSGEMNVQPQTVGKTFPLSMDGLNFKDDFPELPEDGGNGSGDVGEFEVDFGVAVEKPELGRGSGVLGRRASLLAKGGVPLNPKGNSGAVEARVKTVVPSSKPAKSLPVESPAPVDLSFLEGGSDISSVGDVEAPVGLTEEELSFLGGESPLVVDSALGSLSVAVLDKPEDTVRSVARKSVLPLVGVKKNELAFTEGVLFGFGGVAYRKCNLYREFVSLDETNRLGVLVIEGVPDWGKLGVRDCVDSLHEKRVLALDGVLSRVLCAVKHSLGDFHFYEGRCGVKVSVGGNEYGLIRVQDLIEIEGVPHMMLLVLGGGAVKFTVFFDVRMYWEL